MDTAEQGLVSPVGPVEIDWPRSAVSRFLDGASKPVGGDAESTVRVVDSNRQVLIVRPPKVLAGPMNALKSIWREAQTLR